MCRGTGFDCITSVLDFLLCCQPSALSAFRCFGALCGCLWPLRCWFQEVPSIGPLVYLGTLVLCGVRFCRLSCNELKKKIVAKVLVNRMGAPLDTVIDGTQTAFVPGRWIGDNVLFHLEELDFFFQFIT